MAGQSRAAGRFVGGPARPSGGHPIEDQEARRAYAEDFLRRLNALAERPPPRSPRRHLYWAGPVGAALGLLVASGQAGALLLVAFAAGTGFIAFLWAEATGQTRDADRPALQGPLDGRLGRAVFELGPAFAAMDHAERVEALAHSLVHGSTAPDDSKPVDEETGHQ